MKAMKAAKAMKAMIKGVDRIETERKIQRYLNENSLHGANKYYSCGDLGILHVYWYGSMWMTEWIEIEEWHESEMREARGKK